METKWLWNIITIALLLSQNINGENHIVDELKNTLEPNSSSSKSKTTKTTTLTSSKTEEKSPIPNKEEKSNQPHSRRKRLIWITDDGRLALPPGMTLTMTPTIALPLVRYPPEGFLSNITISLPVTIDFDKLGLTDNENPLGVLPPVFARSFGRAAGSMLGNYIASYMHYRKKREAVSSKITEMRSKFHINVEHHDEEAIEPEIPSDYRHAFHGGERAILYGIVEDFIQTFGLNGKGCLLRTICEVHSNSLSRFGVFGEMVKLFLSARHSPYADHMSEYVQAQEIGEGKLGPGECFPYYKDCPRGLFKQFYKNKYSDPETDSLNDENHKELLEDSYNEMESEIFDQNHRSDKLHANIKSM